MSITPTFFCALARAKSVDVVDAREPVAVAGEKAVPLRVEPHGVVVVAGAGAEREHRDAGLLVARRVGGGERAGPRQPLVDLRRPVGEVLELELVEQVDDDRRLDEPDGRAEYCALDCANS